MTDRKPVDWGACRNAAAQANQLNKDIVFDALAKAGITHVFVGFDGESDDGQMERASAKAGGKAVEFPQTSITLHISGFSSADLTLREMMLQDAVEHLCYGFLEEQCGGWEINGGSFGEFVFNVAGLRITLDFYGRVVETHHSLYRF